MVKSIKEKLNELLIESNLVTKEQLDKAIEEQKKRGGGNLSRLLVEQGSITENDLMALLSQETDIPIINLSRYKIDQDVARIVPERMARYYRLIPISRLGNIITVATADPFNILAIDDIRLLTNYEIKPVISTDKEILKAIDKCFVSEAGTLETILKDSKEEYVVSTVEDEKFEVGEVEKESRKAPIIKMVDLLLSESLKRRASDIHIEPYENKLRIRYRVDGALQEAFTLPKTHQNAIMARLKIMSGMDITEARLPQDGRFKVKLEEREVDFRVSVLPITHGGKVVLRALDKSSLSIGLDRLGFSPNSLKLFKESVAKPYGMILITGPTGSGKSTTLYSIINQLNTQERNIMTVEDPVEYLVDGITQVQVHQEIGLTFANGLRSILRQSPDIILVGEIRDFETADIAIKASLTGQLVFSTLHTNDAPGAVTRLVDMGIEPFLIASSVIMVAAQRLCRKICQNCKEPVDIPESELKELGIEDGKNRAFYHGRGCPQCRLTGYYGRMGASEIFVPDDTIKDMIINRSSSHELKTYAVQHGMKTLRDDAVEKFVSGLTTLEEILRITSEE